MQKMVPFLKNFFQKLILLVLPMLGKKSRRMHVKLDSGDPPRNDLKLRTKLEKLSLFNFENACIFL